MRRFYAAQTMIRMRKLVMCFLIVFAAAISLTVHTPAMGYPGDPKPTLSCGTNYHLDRELCKFWRDYDDQTYEEYRTCVDEAIQDLEDCVSPDPDPNENSWR